MTKIEIDVNIPEGYEATGEFREPKKDEPFINDSEVLMVRTPVVQRLGPRIILRKIKQWRDPILPQDWGKEARFTDDGGKSWVFGSLQGYSKADKSDSLIWESERGLFYKFCQVTDD